MGGVLARFKSKTQLDDVITALGTTAYFWIGLNDDDSDNIFVWDETNIAAAEVTVDWWAQGEPAYGFQCVKVEAVSRKLTTDYCTIQSYFLCIEPNSGTTKCPTTPTTPEATTPTTTPTTTSTTTATTTVANTTHMCLETTTNGSDVTRMSYVIMFFILPTLTFLLNAISQPYQNAILI
ncbi:integumentary mucin C.1-like [Physella acuta]|uniref:integumentary mucin C.1-like n=1 Tax=Physella acuta TaxID=109671 RepID=UPI0027DB4678|nr:integumentary mucin C.1-like [Physella acuta]